MKTAPPADVSAKARPRSACSSLVGYVASTRASALSSDIPSAVACSAASIASSSLRRALLSFTAPTSVTTSPVSVVATNATPSTAACLSLRLNSREPRSPRPRLSSAISTGRIPGVTVSPVCAA